MMEVAIIAVFCVVLLLLIVWLVRESPDNKLGATAEPRLAPEELFPIHCRYFPQVRRALSAADETYLQERASPQTRRRARAERREVARRFLRGLEEDFTRLDRLGRTVAALSPKVRRRREAERFWLAARFRILYQLAALRLATGSASLPLLERLTELIGGLAAQIETSMAALEESPASRLRSSVSS